MKHEDIDRQRIILFDGVCNLCNASVDFILQREKSPIFRFASIQSEAGQKLLQSCGLPAHYNQTVILIDDGKIYFGSTAALNNRTDSQISVVVVVLCGIRCSQICARLGLRSGRTTPISVFRETGYVHGANRKAEASILIKTEWRLSSPLCSSQFYCSRAMRIIHAAVVFLACIFAITVHAQDHHPAADGTHRNGISFRRRPKRSRILHFRDRPLK